MIKDSFLNINLKRLGKVQFAKCVKMFFQEKRQNPGSL